MKFLLILLALLAGVYLWRSGRSNADKDKAVKHKPGAAQPPALQDMVRCAVCTVHLPQTDAVRGKQTWYCCNDHRQRGER